MSFLILMTTGYTQVLYPVFIHCLVWDGMLPPLCWLSNTCTALWKHAAVHLLWHIPHMSLLSSRWTVTCPTIQPGFLTHGVVELGTRISCSRLQFAKWPTAAILKTVNARFWQQFGQSSRNLHLLVPGPCASCWQQATKNYVKTCFISLFKNVFKKNETFVFGWLFVKRFALCYRTIVLSICLSVLSVSNVGALWPNGWWIKMKLGMQVASALATLC